MKMRKEIRQIKNQIIKNICKINPLIKLTPLTLFLKKPPSKRIKIEIGILVMICILALISMRISHLEKKMDSADYIKKADSFYGGNNYQKAMTIYEEVTRKFPDTEEGEWSSFQIGNCYKKLGSFFQAISFYKLFVRKYPSSKYLPEVKYNLALCYKETGDLEKANQELIKIIHNYPQEKVAPKAYLALGECLREKDAEASLCMYQKIIRMYPHSSEVSQAYLNMANIYFEEKHYSEAILSYLFLLKRCPEREGDKILFNLSRCYLSRKETGKALPLLLSLLENFPKSDLKDEAFSIISGELFKGKKYEEALKIFQKIKSIYPENSFLKVKAQENIGKIYFIQGKYLETIKIYEKILKEHPYIKDAEEILLRLASSYENIGDYKMASKTYQEFIHYFPLSTHITSAYITLGECFFKQNLYLKGIKILRRVIRNPGAKENELKEAYYNLAQGYFTLGLYKKARETFYEMLPLLNNTEEKLKIQLKIGECYLKEEDTHSLRKFLFALLNEFNNYSLSFQDYFEIGNLFLSVDEKKEALQMYEKAINKEEVGVFQRISLLHRVAKMQRESGDTSAAIKTYQKILNLNGKDVLSLFRLGDLYYSLKKYKEACYFYEAGIKENPDDEKVSWALYQIGNCYQYMGNIEKAREFYQKVSKDFPEDFWGTLAKKRDKISSPLFIRGEKS